MKLTAFKKLILARALRCAIDQTDVAINSVKRLQCNIDIALLNTERNDMAKLLAEIEE